MKKITLTPFEMEGIMSQDWENFPQFTGWSIDYDSDSGSFDREKGAVYDFDVYLYMQTGDEPFIGNGGYMGQDLVFNDSITFEEMQVEEDEPNIYLTDNEKELIKIMMDHASDSPIGIECLYGYDMDNDEIEANFNSLRTKL